MRRVLPLCLFALLCLLFLSAFGAPYTKHNVDIYIDGEQLIGHEVRIESSHEFQARREGGYAPLYRKLRRKYTPKECLNYIGVGLGDYLSAECEHRRIDPLNATLEWTKKISDPFIYYKERAGRQVDLDLVGGKVARALDHGGTVRVLSEEVTPEVTCEDLGAQTALMGKYVTSFRTSGENRRHNIRLAAEAINGTLLQPQETFSFNGVVGQRTEERGFRVANIVIQGEFVKGVGGGVCQVSTTLYNAVLLAGLTPNYAAAHSRPVSYVAYSRDCTVSEAIDFTFTNDTPYPLYLAAEVQECTLTFCVFGKKEEGEYTLRSEVLQSIPFLCKDEKGEVLRDVTGYTLISAGREGVHSVLYRTYTHNGIRSVAIVRENYYPPKNALYSLTSEAPNP